MSTELLAALIGALVGGGFAVLGSVLQHWLSLREDRIKRERDEAREEQQLNTRNIDKQLQTIDEELADLLGRHSYVIDELDSTREVVTRVGDEQADKLLNDLYTEFVFLDKDIQRLREDRQRLMEQRRETLSKLE